MNQVQVPDDAAVIASSAVEGTELAATGPPPTTSDAMAVDTDASASTSTMTSEPIHRAAETVGMETPPVVESAAAPESNESME